MNDNRTANDFARDMVSREIRYCVSSLVHTLMADASNQDALMTEDDAYVLSSRAPDADDYRDAATYDADTIEIVTAQPLTGDWHWSATDIDGSSDEGRSPTELDAWQEAFKFTQRDMPSGSDCLEHWLVTDWLAEKLEAQGEAVARDVAGLTIWGRCTSGQAIYVDAVIQRISEALRAA